MYHVLAVMSAAIAVLLLWKALRSILERLERLEETDDHLNGRLALLEDAMALPSAMHPVEVMPDAETASETSDDTPPPIVHEEATVEPVQQVTEVITLIDGIDDEAKRLRKELRRRGLPARGGIDEMRTRLAKVDEAASTSHVAIAQ